jgi:hypothetical protein
VEALKVLDITHPGTVSSPVFTEVFCEVVALWSGVLDLLLLASFVLCRISGIPASGRVVAAAGKSLQGYPEIHRSASRPTHKLELVSVCAADRGWLIHLGCASAWRRLCYKRGSRCNCAWFCRDMCALLWAPAGIAAQCPSLAFQNVRVARKLYTSCL